MGRQKKSPAIARVMGTYPEPKLDWSIIESLCGVIVSDFYRDEIANSIKLYFSKTNAKVVHAQEVESFSKAANKLAEEWGKLKPKLSFQSRDANLVLRFGNYDEAIMGVSKFAGEISELSNTGQDKSISEWDSLIEGE